MLATASPIDVDAFDRPSLGPDWKRTGSGYRLVDGALVNPCPTSVARAFGGHVVVGDFVFLGGLCAIHQFCRIGDFAFIGGCAAVPTDVIPYASATGNHAHLSGLNIIGMKRRGMSRASMHDLRAAYKALFADEGSFQERLDGVAAGYAQSEEVMRIVNFIKEDTRRPLMAPPRRIWGAGENLA